MDEVNSARELTPEERTKLLSDQIERIGRGTFSDVFKLDNWFGRTVAIKHISDSTSSQDVKVLRQLSHPFIMRLFAYCNKPAPTQLLLLEYCENGSLANVVNVKGSKPAFTYTLKMALDWARQIADAVAFMHKNGFVHRDLKLENILLRHNYTEVRVGDFGSARNVQTQMTNYLGTPLTMAPEVMVGTAYDSMCDVYSFGIVFWQILSRQQPLDVTNHFQLMYAVVNKRQRPSFFLTNNSVCIELLNLLFHRFWHFNPQLRPTMVDTLNILNFLLRHITYSSISEQQCLNKKEKEGGEASMFWMKEEILNKKNLSVQVLSYLNYWMNFYERYNVPKQLLPAKANLFCRRSFMLLHDHNKLLYKTYAINESLNLTTKTQR